jgi:hypothetical protein
MDIKMDLTQIVGLVVSLVAPVLIIVLKWLMDRGRLIGLTLLIVVLPVCFYYFAFVASQNAYFAKRNFQELRDIGNQINSKIDNLASNLLAAGQPSRQDTSITQTSVRPAARMFEPRVELSVREEQGSFLFVFTYLDGTDSRLGNLFNSVEINAFVDPSVPRYLTDDVTQTDDGVFDAVLIAEQASGRVIFARGGQELRIGSLDTLYNQQGSKLELKSDQSSRLVNVQLAGADYVLFLQPFRLTLPAEGATEKQGAWLVAAGLATTARFRAESFAVSYTTLFGFVFMVLLLALSWPLLKLRLMGPRDRLRRGDLALTLFSALMGTALLTLLFLDAHTYLNLETTLDGNLAQLSENIKSNFHQEVSEAVAQLRQLNEELRTRKDSGVTSNLQDFTQMVSPTISGAPSLIRESNILTDRINWETAPYPYFNTATWVDSSGLQRIKWTTRPNATPFVNVSSRRYFNSVMNGDLWKLGTGSESECYVESVRSKTTGEKVAVIAIRAADSLPLVSSLDTKLMSLTSTILPAGYGHAVIDSDGNVLFHSNEVSILEEHFFEKCDNDRLLRACVSARKHQFVSVPYLGKPHRLFVSPMTGTPWSLVVFRDKQVERTINLEMLTLSLIPYLSLGLSVLLVVLLTYLPRQGELIGWLWPREERAGHYRLLIIINVLLCGAFFVALQVKNEWVLIICCFLAPAIGTTLAARILTSSSGVQIGGKITGLVERWAFSYRTLYVLAFAGLLALFSIFPAAGFFRVARTFELKMLVKYGQVSLARALEQRNHRVTLQYSTIEVGNGGEEEKAAFLMKRLDAGWDVYDSFFFGTRRVESGMDRSAFFDEEPGAVESLFAQIRPLYNNVSVDSQGFSASASPDRLWRWTLDRERLLLQKDKEGREGESWIALVSAIPIGGPGFSGWIFLILMTAGLLLLIYYVVRFLARNFFILDQATPQMIGFDTPPCTKSDNVVLLRPPGSDSDWDPNEYRLIDLRRLSILQDQEDLLVDNSPTEGQIVVLEHFDHCMDDPKANCKKLRMIETLLIENQRTLVVSTVDPFRFPLVLDGTATDHSLAARWSTAFSTFVTVFQPDEASAEFVESNPALLRTLKTSQPWRYLERLCATIRWPHQQVSSDDYAASGEEQLNQVVDQARSYHQSLWATCSTDERGTLIHLAIDGMINAKNTDLRQLIKRGLVVRDPTLQLMDESFRRFVISASVNEDIDAYRKGGFSTWEVVKIPLLLLLLSVTLFLFLTQKDIADSTVAFALAATVIVGALFRLLGLSQPRKRTKNND